MKSFPSALVRTSISTAVAPTSIARRTEVIVHSGRSRLAPRWAMIWPTSEATLARSAAWQAKAQVHINTSIEGAKGKQVMADIVMSAEWVASHKNRRIKKFKLTA